MTEEEEADLILGLIWKILDLNIRNKNLE